MNRAAAALLAMGTLAAAAPRFPDALRGRWREADEPSGCDAGAVHGHITITAGKVAEGEFFGRLAAIRPLGARSWQTREIWDIGEEPPQRVERYAASANGLQLSVRRIAGSPALGTRIYIRCGTDNG